MSEARVVLGRVKFFYPMRGSTLDTICLTNTSSYIISVVQIKSSGIFPRNPFSQVILKQSFSKATFFD